MRVIDSFSGANAFLSNFWPATVVLDGMVFRSTEHAYQAAKFDDVAVRVQIQAAPSPGQAKKLGRLWAPRPDWDSVRIDVMLDLLRQKFSPDAALSDRLLATGDAELIEGCYWHDSFWGVCNCGRCPPGQNHLGKLLMKIRDELEVGL